MLYINVLIAIFLVHIYRKRFRPIVSVTYHNDYGNTETENVDLSGLLGESSALQPNDNQYIMPEEPELSDQDMDEESGERPSSTSQPSLYYKKVEKKQKAWENLREMAIRKRFECVGKRLTQKCISCNMEGEFRCTDCGPMATFCEKCMLAVHTMINMFHHVEILKVMCGLLIQ